MSGALNICKIPEDLLAKLKKFRFQKNENSSAIVLKIIKESQEIAIDEEIDELSIDELRSNLPDRQPRFVIISFKIQHSDGRLSFPLCLVFSSPLGCNPELQMLYAGSKNNLAKESGVGKEFEIRDLEDLTDEFLLERLELVLGSMALTSSVHDLPYSCTYCSYSFAMTKALQVHCLANHSEDYIKNLLSSTKPFTLLNNCRRDDVACKSNSVGNSSKNVAEKENRNKFGRESSREPSRNSPYTWKKPSENERKENYSNSKENVLLADRQKRKFDRKDDETLSKRINFDAKSSSSTQNRSSDMPKAAKIILDKYLHKNLVKHSSVAKTDLARLKRRLDRTPYFPLKVHGLKHLKEVTIYFYRGIEDLLKNLTCKTTKLFRQCEPSQFRRVDDVPSSYLMPRFKRRRRFNFTYEQKSDADGPMSNWVMKKATNYRFRERMYDFRLERLQRADDHVVQNVIHLFCNESLAGEIGRNKVEMMTRKDAPNKQQPLKTDVNVDSLLKCFWSRIS